MTAILVQNCNQIVQMKVGKKAFPDQRVTSGILGQHMHDIVHFVLSRISYQELITQRRATTAVSKQKKIYHLLDHITLSLTLRC